MHSTAKFTEHILPAGAKDTAAVYKTWKVLFLKLRGRRETNKSTHVRRWQEKNKAVSGDSEGLDRVVGDLKEVRGSHRYLQDKCSRQKEQQMQRL